MATIDGLREKVQKSEEKVEKCKGTIVRHEKQLEKKKQVLIKKGYDISDLEKIKWDNEGKGSEVYSEVCDIEWKIQDIKGANDKLKKAESVLEKWEKSLQIEIEKERFLEGNAPEVIKVFLESWKQLAYAWHKKRYSDYLEFCKKINKEVEEEKEKIGLRKGFPPNDEQRKHLEDKGLDYHSVKDRKNSFAGGTVLYMVTIRNEDERNAWLEKTLEQEKKAKMLDLVTRINGVVGTITDASSLKISPKGNLDGIVIGTDGKANVSTVGAGGWNIQCFHYRTLVHEVK